MLNRVLLQLCVMLTLAFTASLIFADSELQMSKMAQNKSRIIRAIFNLTMQSPQCAQGTNLTKSSTGLFCCRQNRGSTVPGNCPRRSDSSTTSVPTTSKTTLPLNTSPRPTSNQSPTASITYTSGSTHSTVIPSDSRNTTVSTTSAENTTTQHSTTEEMTTTPVPTTSNTTTSNTPPLDTSSQLPTLPPTSSPDTSILASVNTTEQPNSASAPMNDITTEISTKTNETSTGPQAATGNSTPSGVIRWVFVVPLVLILYCVSLLLVHIFTNKWSYQAVKDNVELSNHWTHLQEI